MNKRQIEVHKKLLNDEEDILKRLEENYQKSLDEIQEKIKILQADELTQSKIYQLEYQRALEKQVTGILEVLKGNNFQTVNEYLKVCYEDSFIGTLYDLHGQGIPLLFPIDQAETATMIQKTHNDIKLSKRLYDNVDVLKDEVISEVSRGISNGYSWQQVARNLAAYSGISLHRAKTIAQTEGHRVQQQSQMKTLEKAKDSGADVVKQWDSTLDSRTREDHQKLDGQIRELDEPFEVNGREAMYPGGFGIASEDINCRCCMLQRAKWALDEEELEELKKRAEFFGIDKADDFDDFKKKYLKVANEEIDEIAEYKAIKSKYNESLLKLDALEKETDEIFDKYMYALDTEDEKRLENLHSQKYDELESYKEIVKDLKSQLSGKEARAVRQIEKKLAVSTGIPINKIEMTGLPYESADMVYTSYETVLSRYPELKGKLAAFKYDGARGAAYAGCEALTGKINAHGIFGNYAKIVKQYADDVASEFHPAGTDHRSVIVHELGHALDGYLTKKNLFDGKVTKYGSMRSSSSIQLQVLDRLGWFDEVTKIKDNMYLKGSTYREISDEIEKQRKSFIKKHVSEYASYNANEFFAECFAEYLMSKKPRKAAQIFGEIIDDGLGR